MSWYFVQGTDVYEQKFVDESVLYVRCGTEEDAVRVAERLNAAAKAEAIGMTKRRGLSDLQVYAICAVLSLALSSWFYTSGWPSWFKTTALGFGLFMVFLVVVEVIRRSINERGGLTKRSRAKERNR